MVQFEELDAAIQRAIPDAKVQVEDLSGTGDHLKVNVVSNSFAVKTIEYAIN